MKKTNRTKNLIVSTLIASMMLASFTPAFGAEADTSEHSVHADVSITSESDSYCNPEYTEEKKAERYAEAEKVVDEVIKEYITPDMDEFEKAYYMFEWLLNYAGIEHSDASIEYNHIYYTDEYGYFFFVGNEEAWMSSILPEEFGDIGSQKFIDNGFFTVSDKEFNKKYSFSESSDYIIYKKIPSSELSQHEKEVINTYGQIFHKEAYGALIQKSCTSAGYANALKIFLDKFGIENTIEDVYMDYDKNDSERGLISGLITMNILTIKGTTILLDNINKVILLGNLDTHRSNVIDPVFLYSIIYNKRLPERYIFGKMYNVLYTKLDLGNGNYIITPAEIEYTSKKPNPEIKIYYNGVTYSSKNKEDGIVVKFKGGKRAHYENEKQGNSKTSVTVFIKKIKGNPELTAVIKEKFHPKFGITAIPVVPFKVSSNSLRVKMKDTTVKRVEVNFGDGKYKRVSKKMWKQDGNNLIFSKNFKGTVSINELA